MQRLHADHIETEEILDSLFKSHLNTQLIESKNIFKKLLNEHQLEYEYEIKSKNDQLQKLSIEILESTQLVEKTKIELQTLKQQYDQKINELKEDYRAIINEYRVDIDQLIKCIQQKDKLIEELNAQVRKQAEFKQSLFFDKIKPIPKKGYTI